MSDKMRSIKSLPMEFEEFIPWIDKKVCHYCGMPLNCGYNSLREMYFLACEKIRGKSHNLDMADPASLNHLRFNWHVKDLKITFVYNYRSANETIIYTTKHIYISMSTKIPSYWKNIMEKIISNKGSSEDYMLFY